jgi:hypothetical protein
MPWVSRKVVYWFGYPPSADEEREFANRELALRVSLPEDTIFNLDVARAVVFSGKPPYVNFACERLARAKEALNTGLMVCLLADDTSTQAHLEKHLPSPLDARLRDSVLRITGDRTSHRLAQAILTHEPGAAANRRLEIPPVPGISLNADDELLLMRAFSDSRRIVLRRLSGGLSAHTFFAQATLTFSEAGPRPMPFFVKLDEPTKISQELGNYEAYATQHIPWYLRPNVDPRRCFVGVNRGILVGSFVDRSESLWSVALKGDGARYIHSLFENTLMGWRGHADRLEMKRGTLATRLDGIFSYENVLPRYMEGATELGMLESPKAIWEHLLDLRNQQWREGIMHGDMHGENVRVRDSDAIVIDLERTRANGPLSADLASLDVWLSFKIPTDAPLPERTVWTAVVADLYRPEAVRELPATEKVDVGLDWLRACIRQTRMIAAASCGCPSEYATAVAIYLLRRATRLPDAFDDPKRGEEDEYRRGHALYLGAKLVQALIAEQKSGGGA